MKPKQLIIKILNQMMTFLIDYIFYNITFIQSKSCSCKITFRPSLKIRKSFVFSQPTA